MSGGKKIPYALNETYSFQLQVCLSIFDILQSLRIKELTLFRPRVGGRTAFALGLNLCDFSSNLSAQLLSHRPTQTSEYNSTVFD